MRHAVGQQAVYSRGVAANAIETSQAEATADPAMMAPAVMRAEDAARVLHAGQPPEAVETGVRAAGGSVIAGVIGDRLARNDPMGVKLFRQYGDRLDPNDSPHARCGGRDAVEHALMRRRGCATGSAPLCASPRRPAMRRLDAVNAASPSTAEPPPVVSSSGMLLDQDGIAGTRERLDEIEQAPPRADRAEPTGVRRQSRTLARQPSRDRRRHRPQPAPR